MTKNPTPGGTRKAFLPPRFVVTTAWKIHRGLYRLSNGKFGLRDAKPEQYGLAQLTTTGRRTMQARSIMIGFFEDEGNYVTMAMNGWASPEPAWWLNLQADPQATLTLPDQVLQVTGRAAESDERDRLWNRWRELDSQLDGWAARRPTETAVVVLTPS